MKQLSTLFFFLIITTVLFAQDAPSLIKKWKLTEIEEFGSKYPLTDNQQNDFLVFTPEYTFTGLLNGESFVGTWSEKAGKFILTPNKEKSAFKVNWIKLISIDSEHLVLNYQSVDLIKTSLFFQVAE
ncbi:MAG: lipocalin family protein [Flavobacteriales bacterium]